MKHTSVFLLLLLSLLALLRFLVACSSPVSSTASGALGDSPTDRCTRMKWPVAHSFAHSFIHFIRFIRLVHSNATTPLAATSKVGQQHRTLAECSGRSACPATGRQHPVEWRVHRGGCRRRPSLVPTHTHSCRHSQASTAEYRDSSAVDHCVAHPAASPRVSLSLLSASASPSPLSSSLPPFRCAALPSSSSPHRHCYSPPHSSPPVTISMCRSTRPEGTAPLSAETVSSNRQTATQPLTLNSSGAQSRHALAGQTHASRC